MSREWVDDLVKPPRRGPDNRDKRWVMRCDCFHAAHGLDGKRRLLRCPTEGKPSVTQPVLDDYAKDGWKIALVHGDLCPDCIGGHPAPTPEVLAGPGRIQRRRVKGWRMPEGAVYVGRGSKWGNPFQYRTPYGLVRHLPNDAATYEYEGRISADGMSHPYYHPDGHVTDYRVRYATREEIVELYRRTILEPDRGMLGAYPSNKGHLATFWTGKRWESEHLTVTPEMIRAELAGKVLACWCKDSDPCHADVLLAIANSEEVPRG